MNISYNWVRQYLETGIEPQRVAKILTGIGLEIEGTYEWSSAEGDLSKIVIGEVVESKRHPDADKLTVNKVNIGSGELLSIVCGAPNVAAGQKVPVALVGAVVSKGEEKIEIKKSKIRGELSEGMICAEDEIGLGKSHDGIMVLDQSAIPGTMAADYFAIEKDTVFEIGLTPNRIDSGSHYGIARDLAAFLTINENSALKANLPSIEGFKTSRKSKTFEIEIKNTSDCRRYSGINIEEVTISESPEWLKRRLRAIGLNPINNIVDITNYVQYECGQPLHAFDADKIKGNKVVIGNLPDKTKFKTLDGVERELSERDLMICNVSEGMCIAGVFGGIDSGVSQNTRNIFLESAWFNPVAIRKTARRHGLNTDASFRFERGADPNITMWALKRAAMLISDIAGGKLTAEPVDVYPDKIGNEITEVSYSEIKRLIGKEIDKEKIRKILSLIEIKILEENGDKLRLEIPAYKVDVKKGADVIEEILRIYGYNNVETGLNLKSTLTFTGKPDREKLYNSIADMLASKGFAEIMCNSLVPSSWFENNDDFKPEELVRLANPLSADLNVMRQSLLYGGLSSVAWNINRQNPDLRFFEFGNCYFAGRNIAAQRVADRYHEKNDLAIIITGKKTRLNWNSKPVATDFFTIKSIVETVLSRLGVDQSLLTTGSSTRKYYSDSISYSFNGKMIAEAGKLSPSTCSRFGIDQEVFYGQVEWSEVIKLLKGKSIYFRELPKYPLVRRDLALLIDRGTKFEQIKNLAKKTEKHILKEVGLFDVYESDALGQNKKSYAVSFILQDEQRTLNDKAIEKVMDNLVRAFEKELGAQVRK